MDLATAVASSPLLGGMRREVSDRLAAAAHVPDVPDGTVLCAIGEALGEISLMHDVPRTADARAEGATRIAEIPREAIAGELADAGAPVRLRASRSR